MERHEAGNIKVRNVIAVGGQEGIVAELVGDPLDSAACHGRVAGPCQRDFSAVF
jgi:hypothetical protein